MKALAVLAASTLALTLAGPAPGPAAGECTNPVLPGFYPDPSICRVGDEYYLVHSTFAYFPGITVFSSKDLVHWKLIGYVIDRADQLNYDSIGVSRGIFAPAIRWHDGVFYVTCTFVDGGGNFVCTARNPAGPWSKPVWLPQVNGIDPSLFFDDDGKAYLVYNSIPPDDIPLYQGHRTIRLRGFDIEGLRVLDDEKILVNGGSDISKKPVWIEAPHIFKVNGAYFLIAAEGGTGENHSEVVFKGASPDGPFVPYKDNPILTQRDLDPNRPDPITCTGHADVVETHGGKWWAVFLGCEPYTSATEDFYNTGRETFLAPVIWKDGWPTILPHGKILPRRFPCPFSSAVDTNRLAPGGTFSYRDDFDAAILDLHWEFLRAPRQKWYSLTQKPGFLALRLRPETCSGKMNPSFLGHRQQHARSSAMTIMEFVPGKENEKAGLLVFQNESHFYFLCKSLEGGNPAVQLFKSRGQAEDMELLASQTLNASEATGTLLLRIESDGATYSFLYSPDGREWHPVKEKVDATFLSTKVAGGFVGCMYALYATSLGAPDTNTACFDVFSYSGYSNTGLR